MPCNLFCHLAKHDTYATLANGLSSQNKNWAENFYLVRFFVQKNG